MNRSRFLSTPLKKIFNFSYHLSRSLKLCVENQKISTSFVPYRSRSASQVSSAFTSVATIWRSPLIDQRSHRMEIPQIILPNGLPFTDSTLYTSSVASTSTDSLPSLTSDSSVSVDDGVHDGIKRSEELWAGALPAAQGLYDPDLEKDSCGVGFVCHIKG